MSAFGDFECRIRADCVEKLFSMAKKSLPEKTDLIERSTIDERISVDGFMIPEISLKRVSK
jgi:hypothetical protein